MYRNSDLPKPRRSHHQEAHRAERGENWLVFEAIKRSMVAVRLLILLQMKKIEEAMAAFRAASDAQQLKMMPILAAFAAQHPKELRIRLVVNNR